VTTWGFRAKKPDGTVLWEITDRLLQFLGVVSSTGTIDGSVVNAALAEPNAVPFCFVYSLTSDAYIEQPVISFAGSTMTWTWPAGTDPAYRTTCRLIYGVR
jgi:hypothetical protein